MIDRLAVRHKESQNRWRERSGTLNHEPTASNRRHSTHPTQEVDNDKEPSPTMTKKKGLIGHRKCKKKAFNNQGARSDLHGVVVDPAPERPTRNVPIIDYTEDDDDEGVGISS